MNGRITILLSLLVLGLTACATVPTGPNVRVMPGPWKPFEVFQSDDAGCRQWAAQQAGTSPSDAANQNLVAGGILGTFAGAGLGAVIGSAYGNPGAGAAIGAASGLLGGTAIASGPAYEAGYTAQMRYDNAYSQCMYAKGNQVPGTMPPRRAYPPPQSGR